MSREFRLQKRDRGDLLDHFDRLIWEFECFDLRKCLKFYPLLFAVTGTRIARHCARSQRYLDFDEVTLFIRTVYFDLIRKYTQFLKGLFLLDQVLSGLKFKPNYCFPFGFAAKAIL